MKNITLIATIHTENGKCNSDELYKILEDVNPDVIFDELPKHFYDMYYGDSSDNYYANNILLNRRVPEIPLEVKAVKKYIQNYESKIIPIDIDLRQNLSEYNDEISFLFQKFLNDEDYQKLDSENEVLIRNKGFQFLNSNSFLDFLERKELLERSIMDSDPEKDRLINMYKIFKELQHGNREKTMLQNIYNYSEESDYKQAVFLIGAGHKKSIMKAINEFENQSEFILNWTFYGNY